MGWISDVLFVFNVMDLFLCCLSDWFVINLTVLFLFCLNFWLLFDLTEMGITDDGGG